MKLRGFTIVEVVVAVAIVTLLAAIVIPDLWAAQQRITGEMFMNNVHDITTTLELYKKEHAGLYPAQLEELASYFDKQPVNQYTKSSMLSSNVYQSGVQYTPSADRKSYTLVVTQRDVNDLDRDKNKTETVAEALGQPFSFVNVQPITPTVARTYIVTLRAVPNNTGQLVAFPNPAKAGQTVMLSQKPANCYNFSSWSSPDVTITNNSFVMPAKDVTVTANYTIRQYTVSAAPNNTSYGTVTGSGTYNCGSTATLTAVPNTGYTFVGWYESGSQVSTTATYAFTVSGNRTLEARFNAIPYTITVNKNPTTGGSPTAAPNPAYVGQTVTLTTNPNSCYNFSSWSSSDVTVTSNSFVMPAKNVTITANYTIRQYTVSAAPNNTSYGTVTGSGTYNCGSTATLTAVPNTGYTFVGWYESGSQVSTTATYAFTVNGNRTLEARFNAIPYTITVNKNPAAGGSPTATPNPAYVGQTVTLTANPDSCYNFSSWSSPDVTITSNSFVMPAKNVSVTANYTVRQYTVSAAPNNTSYGTVTGSGTYNCGSTATLTAVPNTGYTFVGWYESGSQVSTTATYTFTVSGNRTLEARFSATAYTITVNKRPAAGGSPTATPNPAYVGQTVTLTANPSTCYDFTDWISTDVTITGNSFVMPAKNVFVTAIYAIKTYTVSAAPNNPSYGTVTGSGTYNCGSTATLTAVPATGFTFTGWYENGSQVSTATTYIFTVSGNRTLEARFAINITIAFARNSVAYTSNGIQVAAGVPRYETGKFGQAIFIEEGTTNLLTANQSSVEIDTSGLGGWGGPTLTRDTTTWHGGYSFKAIGGSTFSIYTFPQQTSVTAGTAYTGSIYVKSSAPQSQAFAMWWQPNNTASSIGANLTTNWQRVVATGIAPSGASSVYLEMYSAGNYTIWWDGAQLEAKPYATSWTLGGTTRAQETLSISPVSNILTPQQGTIDVWVYVPDFWKPGIPYYRRIWSIGTDAAVGLYWFGYNPAANKMEFSIYKDATIANTIYVDKPAVGWHLFTVRWSASEMSLWIDGVKKGSKTSPSLPTSFASTNLTIGCRSNSPYDNVNTLIDDFRVSNRARTDAEIQTLYQSNQPAPKDADTTLKLTFDGNLTP